MHGLFSSVATTNDGIVHSFAIRESSHILKTKAKASNNGYLTESQSSIYNH